MSPKSPYTLVSYNLQENKVIETPPLSQGHHIDFTRECHIDESLLKMEPIVHQQLR